MPVWVSEGSAAIRAMPKSVSFTCQSRSTRMFDGFTSRCTMPAACAAARASAACHSSGAASSGESAPCSLTSWARVVPSTYSMTSQRASVSASTTKLNTATTCGWLRCAASRASRSARARSVLSAPGTRPIRFRATCRPRTSSRPSQTAPMPPRPISRSRVYLPAITCAFPVRADRPLARRSAARRVSGSGSRPGTGGTGRPCCGSGGAGGGVVARRDAIGLS